MTAMRYYCTRCYRRGRAVTGTHEYIIAHAARVHPWLEPDRAARPVGVHHR